MTTPAPLREIIAKAYAHKSVGDPHAIDVNGRPHAIDVNGRPRWEWFLDDADKFLSIFGHLFADRAPFITDKMAADAAIVLNKRLTTGDLFGVSRDMLQAALAVQPTREALGEMIYRAMYEHKGGMWSANETQDVWFDFADRLVSLMQAQRAKQVTEP